MQTTYQPANPSQPILQKNSDSHQQDFDVKCVQKATNEIQNNKFQQQIQVFVNQQKSKNQQEKLELENALSSIIKHKKIIDQVLDKIIQLIQEQLQIIELLTQKIDKSFMVGNSSITSNDSFEELIKECSNQQQSNAMIRKCVKEQVSEIQKQCCDLNQLFVKDFTYELIKESIKKKDSWYQAFDFNKQGSILIVGKEEQIIVCDFENGIVTKESQVLSKHTNKVITLYFMKQQNSFVSGSKDMTIIIWEFDEKKDWFAKCLLNDHVNTVNCIKMNQIEDLLISASFDCTLKFWIKNNSQFGKEWVCAQTINPGMKVLDLSLNKSGNKLICTGEAKRLNVLILLDDKKWVLHQTLEINNSVACFTIGDQFAVQLPMVGQLEVYDYDSVKQQFIRIRQIELFKDDEAYRNFCQFLGEFNILAIRYGKFLNIFKISEDGNYYLISKIDLNKEWVYKFTEDCQYLLTKNNVSNEIQVRQLKNQD